MAEKPTNINTLKPGQVVDYARRSVTRGRDGTSKSISDQHDCNQETADFYGLPLTSENWMTEEKNHGGDECWKKCPEIGLEWGAASDQPYRPTLTKSIHCVVKGQIKCVIVCFSCPHFYRFLNLCAGLNFGVAATVAYLDARRRKHNCGNCLCNQKRSRRQIKH